MNGCFAAFFLFISIIFSNLLCRKLRFCIFFLTQTKSLQSQIKVANSINTAVLEEYIQFAGRVLFIKLFQERYMVIVQKHLFENMRKQHFVNLDSRSS